MKKKLPYIFNFIHFIETIFVFLLLYLSIYLAMNFASFFNQFRSQPAANILNELLSDTKASVARLLQEETFISEYKSATPKVTQYMNYGRFQELTEFITVVGPPQDKKRSFKFPQTVCELLSTDNMLAVDFFLPEKPLTIEQKVQEEVEVQVQEEIQDDQNIEAETSKDQKSGTITSEETSSVSSTELSEAKQESPAEQPKQTKIEDNNSGEQKKTQQQVIPALKKMKIVTKTIKRMQQKINKIQKQPLINKLMLYFNGEVNYTLAGYVCKVLSIFHTKRPTTFNNYFLKDEVISQVLNHAQSRSVGQLLIKILVVENNEFLEQRKELFNMILQRLQSPSEIYIISNLSSYVIEVIEKIAANLKGQNRIAQFIDVFFSLETVTKIIRNVNNEDKNVSQYNSPILYAILASVPLVISEDENIVAGFIALLKQFISNCCKKLATKSNESRKFGVGRLKLVQIIRYLLKENILNCRQIIANQSQFFSLIPYFFRQHPHNNLLHNEIYKIIEMSLNEPEGASINNTILNGPLLKFIKEEIEQDQRIRGGHSVYKSRKGFIAHLINISVKLKQASQTNQQCKQIMEDPQYSKIYQSFFDKQIFNSKSSLAGFQMKKDIKHQVMFQKQDIISAYANFLRRCPPPVYNQPEVDMTDKQEPVDLILQLQKEIEQKLISKPKQEKQQIEIDFEDKKEGEGKEHPFWQLPLQYDLEELQTAY